MALQLVQVRACDGKCCRESPRFPNVDHSDCIYHDTLNGKENAGCMLMRSAAPIPINGGVPLGDLTTEEVYQETCVAWPQKNSIPEPRDTGGCCWQWIDDGQRKA